MSWRGAAVVSTCFAVAAAGGVAVAFATRPAPGHRHPTTARAAVVVASPSPSVSPAPAPGAGGPYFATPQAAMRYLAAAWNRHDDVALWHVTTPDGRNALEAMRSEAVNLRLRACTKNPAGDYTCVFDHDYPASMHKKGHGTATFIAGPAREHGWYMTYFEGCG